MAETTYDRTKPQKRFTAAVSRGLRESAVLAIGVVALVMLVAVQLFVLGLYLPPVFNSPLSPTPPHTIISVPVQMAV